MCVWREREFDFVGYLVFSDLEYQVVVTSCESTHARTRTHARTHGKCIHTHRYVMAYGSMSRHVIDNSNNSRG